MTNFDSLLSSPDFASFGEAAVAAEKIYAIDPAACVMTCRRAMENAVKWMYSVDSALSMPWDDKLVSLLGTEEFRDIVDTNLMRRLEYIRKIGNVAVHQGGTTRKEAYFALLNTYNLIGGILLKFGVLNALAPFDKELIPKKPAPFVAPGAISLRNTNHPLLWFILPS